MVNLIEIDGERIKTIRKLKGYTQKTLAEGICSQATISNIERQGYGDSLDILSKLCHRLDITIDTVLENNHTYVLKNLLEKLKKLSLIGEHEKLKKALDSFLDNFSFKKMSFDEKDIIILDYYMGISKLFAEKDYFESLFYFQRVLDSLLEEHDIIKIMTINSLGVAYDLMEKEKQALHYMDRSAKLLEKSEIEYIEASKIYYNISKFYSKLNETNKAVNYSRKGIDNCIKYHSIIALDFLYYELSYNLYDLGKVEKAVQGFNQALFLTQLNKNIHLEKVIRKNMLERNLNIYF